MKTIGDVIISAWVIGYVKSGMPVPLWDVLEAVSPLTSTGAGLLNGLQAGGSSTGPDIAVAYFAALLILVLTFIILAAGSLAQRYLRRRYAR